VEPLDVVWDGEGVGAGVLGGGVGLGLGLAVVGVGAGAVEWPVVGAELPVPWPVAGCVAEWPARPVWPALWLGEADAVPVALGLLPAGVFVAVGGAAAVLAAAWLNRFAPPATPTTLSSVARHVSLDNLRRLASRRAPRCCRCRMGPTRPHGMLRDHQEELKAVISLARRSGRLSDYGEEKVVTCDIFSSARCRDGASRGGKPRGPG